MQKLQTGLYLLYINQVKAYTLFLDILIQLS